MKQSDIEYYNHITNKQYKIYLNTGSFDPDDFEYGYFIIRDIKYRFYNETFINAVDSVRMWEALKQ